MSSWGALAGLGCQCDDLSIVEREHPDKADIEDSIVVREGYAEPESVGEGA